MHQLSIINAGWLAGDVRSKTLFKYIIKVIIEN